MFEYRGYETKDLRRKYGYRKTQVKSADQFTAHCSDSLALATDVFGGRPRVPCVFLAADDTYRPKRGGLHYTQPSKGGNREPYSLGTVVGLRKGLLIGLLNGKSGQLCGVYNGGYRYCDAKGKRGCAKRVHWISSNFNTRRSGVPLSPEGDSPLAVFL